MSNLEQIINISKDLESALESKFGAVGKGLHEKISSVEHILNEELIRKVRFIATIRNKAVHESGYSVNDRDMERVELYYADIVGSGVKNITYISTKNDDLELKILKIKIESLLSEKSRIQKELLKTKELVNPKNRTMTIKRENGRILSVILFMIGLFCLYQYMNKPSLNIAVFSFLFIYTALFLFWKTFDKYYGLNIPTYETNNCCTKSTTDDFIMNSQSSNPITESEDIERRYNSSPGFY